MSQPHAIFWILMFTSIRWTVVSSGNSGHHLVILSEVVTLLVTGATPRLVIGAVVRRLPVEWSQLEALELVDLEGCRRCVH